MTKILNFILGLILVGLVGVFGYFIVKGEIPQIKAQIKQ